jgi:hypothetical protein
LLSLCAIAPIFESAEDIATIKWDVNPAIPVPKYGCYTGWHMDICAPVLGLYKNMFGTTVGTPEEKKLIGYYEKDYSQGPAVHSFSDRLICDDFFPTQICEGAYNKGVIPLIRYYFTPDFEMVAKGMRDKILKGFAQGATEFGKPFFFIPYPEVNIMAHFKHVHPWAGSARSGGKWFQKAWERMHNIFEQEGANEYAVWGLHLIGLDVGQPFSWFAVDNDLIDWVGFTEYNLERQSGGLNRPLSELLRLQGDYRWAKRAAKSI